MKFSIFLILCLGMISLAMASKSTFLDELFMPTPLAGNVNCSATASCAGKDDDCTGNYNLVMNTGSGGCVPANGSCCASGLFCSVNKTCAENTYQAKCNTAADCWPPGEFGCASGTCQYMLTNGDACITNNSNLCPTGMCNANTTTCTGYSAGQSCSSTHQCNFGLYCMYGMMGNMTCQNTTAQGSSCASSAECYPGNVCFKATANNASTCQQVGTQGAGLPCTANACGSGYFCSPTNGTTCQTVNSGSVACSNSANCSTGSTCICSYVTGTAYCQGAGYNNPCSGESVSLIQCLADNSCVGASVAPDSCCQQKCESEYKKSFSCSCSLGNSMYGKCFYNTYCGGFPVWAIIVIIVVAIVLVLAIVLLVFFMMRRRRQYDSI